MRPVLSIFLAAFGIVAADPTVARAEVVLTIETRLGVEKTLTVTRTTTDAKQVNYAGRERLYEEQGEGRMASDLGTRCWLLIPWALIHEVSLDEKEAHVVALTDGTKYTGRVKTTVTADEKTYALGACSRIRVVKASPAKEAPTKPAQRWALWLDTLKDPFEAYAFQFIGERLDSAPIEKFGEKFRLKISEDDVLEGQVSDFAQFALRQEPDKDLRVAVKTAKGKKTVGQFVHHSDYLPWALVCELTNGCTFLMERSQRYHPGATRAFTLIVNQKQSP